MTANPQVIRAGEDSWIEARNITDVRTGNLIDVSGFSVQGVARAMYQRYVLGRPSMRSMRYRMLSPIVAEWSTTPTGTQGAAVAGLTGGTDPNLVTLHITPTQSLSWRCPLVIIEAELTDPVTGYISRIISETYEVSQDAVAGFQ